MSDWAGKRTGLLAGRKESHFVIRRLLFSLLIPFRVSWDEKHQVVSGSWRVSLVLLSFCGGASFLSKPVHPLPSFPQGTAEPLTSSISVDGGGWHSPFWALPPSGLADSGSSSIMAARGWRTHQS